MTRLRESTSMYSFRDVCPVWLMNARRIDRQLRKLVAHLAVFFTLYFLPCDAAALKYSASANFSVDLLGEPDTRLNTWGTAGQSVWPVHFDIPQMYRVRILRVYGDFLIWPRGEVPIGKYAGALFSLHTSTPEKPISEFTDLMVKNCFLYLQLATSGQPQRAPFDHRVSSGGLLDKDNTLYVKVAVWLNDTGLELHMEPTWVTVFQIEDASGHRVDLPNVSVYGSKGMTQRRTTVRGIR